MREHGGPPPKSLDSDENFEPELTLFCREIKICSDLRTFWKSLDKNLKPEHTVFCRKLICVTIYARFEDLWAKKCLFGSKQCFLGKKCSITWYILHILLS